MWGSAITSRCSGPEYPPESSWPKSHLLPGSMMPPSQTPFTSSVNRHPSPLAHLAIPALTNGSTSSLTLLCFRPTHDPAASCASSRSSLPSPLDQLVGHAKDGAPRLDTPSPRAALGCGIRVPHQFSPRPRANAELLEDTVSRSTSATLRRLVCAVQAPRQARQRLWINERFQRMQPT